MTEQLIKELKKASYTMPGICKDGHEMIDLDKVIKILEKHLKKPETRVKENNEYY